MATSTRRYVIIGTGAAGLAAAETIRERDPSADLTIFGDDPYGFYSRPGLAYYLNGEVLERQLALRQASGLRHVKAKVVALDPTGHQVTTQDGHLHRYDRLLLATGSIATKIPNPGSDLEGVVKLDNMDDAKGIVKVARRSKGAVVVGGGIIALEFVEGLLARGIETHYMIRSERYWPNVLDPIESAHVEKRLKHHGVRFHYKAQLAKIIEKRGKVAGIETDQGEQIKCQLLGVAIGVQPRMELAKAAGLKTDRGILTGEFLETSVEDIFAAGDVAQVFDPFSGKAVLDTLWSTAMAQGRAAGSNMAGARQPYVKSVAFNVCRLANVTTTIIGAVGQDSKDQDLVSLSRGDSESWRQLPGVMAVQTDSEVNRVRIMTGPKALVGAVVMGDQTLSQPLHGLIANQVDISPIRDELASPNVPLADKIIDFWMQWSRANEAAKR